MRTWWHCNCCNDLLWTWRKWERKRDKHCTTEEKLNRAVLLMRLCAKCTYICFQQAISLHFGLDFAKRVGMPRRPKSNPRQDLGSEYVEECGRMWKNVEGCGRMWKDVEGCGRMWKDVEGCGRMWKDVEVWLKFHSVSLSLARGKSRFLLCALESEAPGTVLPACYRLTVLKAFRPPGLSASFDGIQQVSIMSQANNGTAYPPKCCFIWKMRINKSVLGYPIIICYW